MAGTTLVIIDSSYPRRLIKGLVESCNPSAIVTADSAYKSAMGIPTFSTEAVTEERYANSGVIADHISPLAYLGPTSGTTGEPKLVKGTHSAVRHFLSWYSQLFELTEDCRFAMLSGISHDPLWRDIFLPLSVGGALYIPSVRTWARTDLLIDFLAEHAVTDLNVTPGMARRFLKSELGTLAAVRRVVLSGEASYWEDVRGFTKAAPRAQFIAAYGATETPQIAALNILRSSDIAARTGLVPIGQASPGFELGLVTPSGSAVEDKAIGEIVIRSRYVTPGYFGRDSTSLRALGGLWEFYTGDLARRLPAGDLLFQGRRDRRIKIRGVRVESGEIEASIRALPDVSDATVSIIESSSPFAEKEEKLLAFVSTMDPSKITGQQVRQHLAGLLPIAALPDDVVILPMFPMNSNGKIDLPAMVDNYQQRKSR